MSKAINNLLNSSKGLLEKYGYVEAERPVVKKRVNEGLNEATNVDELLSEVVEREVHRMFTDKKFAEYYNTDKFIEEEIFELLYNLDSIQNYIDAVDDGTYTAQEVWDYAVEDGGIDQALIDCGFENVLDESLNESNEDLAEYGSFAEYAEERLPHEARYKEYYMEPEEAGKMYVHSGREGKCDLLWVCQEDCSSEDFDTLMKAFGEYYPEETDGKTYTAIMKSRSYPGYGNFIKKVVTFHNGDPVYAAAEKEVLFDGKIELNLAYTASAGFMVYVSCPGEDIEGDYAKTIGEAKDFFEDALERNEEYVSFDPGCEAAGYDVELNTDLPDSYSADDYAKAHTDGSEEEIADLKQMAIDYDLDPIAEGTYTMYQQLKESLNEATLTPELKAADKEINKLADKKGNLPSLGISPETQDFIKDLSKMNLLRLVLIYNKYNFDEGAITDSEKAIKKALKELIEQKRQELSSLNIYDLEDLYMDLGYDDVKELSSVEVPLKRTLERLLHKK